jgi:hypothetical protein
MISKRKPSPKTDTGQMLCCDVFTLNSRPQTLALPTLSAG